ncbi:MAG: N-acetylglucosamine-6-phosphate deacetylase [Clostridiales bacterium]|nr:N-acetylglucosamine-6-phosphate deacetylase [Clostridiales bacterium]
MIIQNGTVFTKDCRFEQKTILTDAERILAVESTADGTSSEVLDATDCYVIPGLTDVHFHGCVGYDFCDGTEEALQAMAVYELKNGVTTICPASMTLAEETLAGICKTAAGYASRQQAADPASRAGLGASLKGINLEGPFLSFAKKGAQNPAYLQKPNAPMLHRLQECANGLVKLVAIAPEEDGAMDCIRELASEMTFSVAHTTADYETARKAMELGAKHVTHLYNAMPPFTHRDPGVIGAAADTSDCDVELICDGVHISAPVVRSTFKLFGDDRVILISDSMMATGMKDGRYALGGQPVIVKGNLATLEDGTIAGSATNLMDCMRTAVKMGIPLESAVKAATINPARSIGIDKEYGSIVAGKHANLVLLNKKDLSIKAVVLEGKVL